jgi:hypothetical protein
VVHARQVHGAGVRFHRDGPPGLALAEPCDGHATGSPGVLLAVTVAASALAGDCAAARAARPAAIVPLATVLPASAEADGAVAAAFPGLGIGFVGVSLAFGLTVVTMAYAVVVALPNWLGAWLAVRAGRGGSGPAATVALWQNLIVGRAADDVHRSAPAVAVLIIAARAGDAPPAAETSAVPRAAAA